jgi:hypothetical protein
MWDHADKPPKGRDYGLKTHKVIVAPRSDREKQILLSDKNAWVGLPVSWCPFEQYSDEKRRETQRSMSQLAFNTANMTPYNKPVVHMDPLKSKKPMERVAQLTKNSFEYARQLEQQMVEALLRQAETETDEEARMRSKARRLAASTSLSEDGQTGDLRANQSRKLRLDADRYFTMMAHTGRLENYGDAEELLSTGSVMNEQELQRHQRHDQFTPNYPTTSALQTQPRSSSPLSCSNGYIGSKGMIRRGARKPLTRSQRNTLREKANMKASFQIFDSTLGLAVTTKYDICKAALSAEEPRLLRLQEIARNNNNSAVRHQYVKLRNQFVHNYIPRGPTPALSSGVEELQVSTIEIKKGENRDRQGLVNDSTWSSTSWGGLKSRVSRKLEQEQKIMEAKRQQSRTLDPGEHAHNMIGTGVLENDVDAYMSVWSRSVYKPPKEVKSRARVWAVKPKRHYKLRYSWLPQPMLQSAAARVFEYAPVTTIGDLEAEVESDVEIDGPSPTKRPPNYSKTWFPVELSQSNVDDEMNTLAGATKQDDDSKIISGLTGECSSMMVSGSRLQEEGDEKVSSESPEQRRMRILSTSGLVDSVTIAGMQSMEETFSLADSLSLLHVQSTESMVDMEAHFGKSVHPDIEEDPFVLNRPDVAENIGKSKPEFSMKDSLDDLDAHIRSRASVKKQRPPQFPASQIALDRNSADAPAFNGSRKISAPSPPRSPPKSAVSTPKLTFRSHTVSFGASQSVSLASEDSSDAQLADPSAPTAINNGRSGKLVLVKTSTFDDYVESTKLKPYHKLKLAGTTADGSADQPYNWH